jgi:hypothetical protein
VPSWDRVSETCPDLTVMVRKRRDLSPDKDPSGVSAS